eukprot:Gb_17752 [translate_table: standard]
MARKINGLLRLIKLSALMEKPSSNEIPVLLPTLTNFRNLNSFSRLLPPQTTNVPSTEEVHDLQVKRKPSRKGRQASRRFLQLLTNVDEDRVQEALQILRTAPEKLSSTQAALLITKIEDPLMVFDFYRFLKVQPGFEPQEGLYAALIETQVKSINPKSFKIRFYLDEMEKRKLKFTQKDYGGLIVSLLPSHLDLAEHCFNLMQLSGTPTVESYNSVVSAFVNHGFYDKALSILEEMSADEICFNLETYCNILTVHKNTGKAREALKTFIEMEDKLILPSEVAYNLLLSTLASAGQVKVASAVLEEMRFLGFKPDEASSGFLTRAYLRENMVNEVDCVLKDGTLKDPDDFSHLINAFTEKKMPSRAVELLLSMQESGMDVGDFICSRVIHACGKGGLVEEAKKIYNYVKGLNRLIDESIYMSMLCVFSREKMQNSAEKVFEEMLEKGYSRRGEAYLYMMSMYGKLGRLEDVLRIFKSMRQSGCSVNVHAYAVLIDIMGKAGKLNEARNFLLEMRMSRIQPNNAIYSTLISAYMSVGLLDRALSYINEFKSSGLKPDGITAGTIATVFARAGMYSELEPLINELARKGIKLPRDKGIILRDLCADTDVSDKIENTLSMRPEPCFVRPPFTTYYSCGELSKKKDAHLFKILTDPNKLASNLLLIPKRKITKLQHLGWHEKVLKQRCLSKEVTIQSATREEGAVGKCEVVKSLKDKLNCVSKMKPAD